MCEMYSLYDAWPDDYNFSRGTLVVVLFVVLTFTEYWILLAIICNIAHRACHGLTVYNIYEQYDVVARRYLGLCVCVCV